MRREPVFHTSILMGSVAILFMTIGYGQKMDKRPIHISDQLAVGEPIEQRLSNGGYRLIDRNNVGTVKRAVMTRLSRSVPVPTPTPRQTTEPNKLPVAEAERRINPHITFIEDRITAMAAAYYYSGAKETLENAFRKAGVRSMGYAGPWGTGGIGLFWSQGIKSWYVYHRERLQLSLEIIRDQGFVMRSDLDYLDRGVQAWKQSEGIFPDQFEILVDLYTRQALAIDERAAISDRYQVQIDRVHNARPFRSDLYNALQAERQRALQPLEIRDKLLESAVDVTEREMVKHAGEHIFEAIDQKPKTGTASGASDSENP